MKSGFADTRFGRIGYAEEGSGDAIVLLPGNGQNHEIFTNQLKALGRHFRAVAIDTEGVPGSAPAPNPLSFERLAEGILATMDALRIGRAHVYGIHTGNKGGAALAAAHPDRVGQFIFSGQSHSIIADNEARKAHIRAVTTHYFNGPTDDPKLLETRRMYEANFAYDLQRDLKRIPNRTLVVEIATKGEDARVGRQGASLLTFIPRSSLVTFEEPDGVGHTLDNRAEELARAIVEFIG